jgi:hypothetical protein
MTDTAPTQSVAVFEGRMFAVIDGVAEGESISFADELVLDDVYHLAGAARRAALVLAAHGDRTGFVVAPGSAVGILGNQVVLDCCITLMAPDSTTYEALVLVEVEAGGVEAIHLLPLAELTPHVDYRLVGVDRHAATKRFAEAAYVSFTRGTHITLASGKQAPIEEMRVGDLVLTRDDGPQAVRWIGQSTIRAVGDFAPVVIKKGVLHNENDLILSPDHRLFVYQRQDKLGAGRSEVLVKVRHLINGDTVFQQDGGFVDYFQLLFDDHQIIYAEGIAAESLLIDPRTKSALPAEAGMTKRHEHRQHFDYEVKEQLLATPDAVELLRKASSS